MVRARAAILGALALLVGQAASSPRCSSRGGTAPAPSAGPADAEQRYRTLADFTHDWEYWQRPDGTFEYVSPSCLPITGYEAEEFYQRPALLDEIVVDEDQPRWEAHGERPRGTGRSGSRSASARRTDECAGSSTSARP